MYATVKIHGNSLLIICCVDQIQKLHSLQGKAPRCCHTAKIIFGKEDL